MFRGHAPKWALTIVAASLSMLPAAAATQPGVAEGSTAKLSEAIEHYNKRRTEVSAQMNAAETPEARQKIYAGAEWSTFTSTFRDIAYSSDGNEAAAEAWVWVFRTGKEFVQEDAKEAVENLLAAHADSKAISGLVQELRYAYALEPAYVERTLAAIAEKAPAGAVKHEAQFALVARLIDGGDRPKAQCDRARELLTSLGESTEKGSLNAQNIERTLFEIDNLQVGMEAPDFEAVDADGVSFKLSDYRGKVVVVDFWGFW